jgi:hypothetical protein
MKRIASATKITMGSDTNCEKIKASKKNEKLIRKRNNFRLNIIKAEKKMKLLV